MWIPDPGWKKFEFEIRDKHPESATLWVKSLSTVDGTKYHLPIGILREG
jgi:hypothetical protein